MTEIDVWCPSCRKRVCILDSISESKDKLMICNRCGTEFVFAKFGTYQK